MARDGFKISGLAVTNMRATTHNDRSYHSSVFDLDIEGPFTYLVNFMFSLHPNHQADSMNIIYFDQISKVKSCTLMQVCVQLFFPQYPTYI